MASKADHAVDCETQAVGSQLLWQNAFQAETCKLTYRVPLFADARKRTCVAESMELILRNLKSFGRFMDAQELL